MACTANNVSFVTTFHLYDKVSQVLLLTNSLPVLGVYNRKAIIILKGKSSRHSPTIGESKQILRGVPSRFFENISFNITILLDILGVMTSYIIKYF